MTSLLRRGTILAGVVLVSVLGGFCLCLLLHRKAQEPRSPEGPAPSPPAPGFVPPSGNRPKRPADVPHGTPVIATGGGRVEFGPVQDPDQALNSAGGKLIPGANSANSPNSTQSGGCFLSPEDIGGDCTFEIVGPPEAPMLRLKWTGRVRVRDGQQVRGPITLPDAKFEWRPPVAPPAAPRTLLGVHAGINSTAGYEIGAAIFPAPWAFQTRYAEGRVGGYATFERDLSDTRLTVGAVVLFGVGRR